MVDFADGAFVTPEGVVILAVPGVRVPDGGEQLVPGGGVGVGLRDAVRGLPADHKHTIIYQRQKVQVINTSTTFIPNQLSCC